MIDCYYDNCIKNISKERMLPMESLNDCVHILPVGNDKSLINKVSSLAKSIYLPHYADCLNYKTAEKMYEIYQTPKAIEYATNKGEEYYLVQLLNDYAGYYSVDIRDDQKRIFLSKLYLDSKCRGKGIGRYIINLITQLAKSRDISAIDLMVCKDNPTCEIYKKLGFKILKSIYRKSKGGLVDDDYLMKLTV